MILYNNFYIQYINVIYNIYKCVIICNGLRYFHLFRFSANQISEILGFSYIRLNLLRRELPRHRL